MTSTRLSQIANSGSAVLVEFYASWCPHCQRMMPVVAEVKELLDGRAPVYQFDIDENEQLAALAHIESVPTFVVYRNGNVFWTHTGEIDGPTLLSKVENALQ